MKMHSDLDFKAVFDQVDHETLTFKLRQSDVSGPFLNIITEFL